uniref:Spermatogenesis-associated protein 24 n=1 Tax=Anthurium amnicola TaxID=1678845 RepID=A0A1D1YR39_9ARAE
MSVSTTAAAAAAVAQNPSRNRPSSRFYPIPICRNRPKAVTLSSLSASRAPAWCVLHLVPLQRKVHSLSTTRWHLRAFVSGEAADGGRRRDVAGQRTFDEALVIMEALCIAPSVVFAIGSVVGLVLPGMQKQFQASLGNVFVVWQFVLLVGAVAIGAMIRRRQWQRFCRENGASVNLIDRIEKVEEDLRSSATIIRVLSRQLEKLGIRFRVTRKALKEPITEMAALAQKNSEATRALALQEDILEKELGEIQKVLLAMQEQQQKQLELVLAIGKAGRLIESKKDLQVKQEIVTDDGASSTNSSILEKKERMEFETGKHQLSNNDRA